MAQIQLTKGYFSIVDEADLPLLTHHKWWPAKIKKRHKEYVYASTRINGKSVRMHRLLMGLEPGNNMVVDHIDGDTLNNSRTNLRICTRSENSHNSAKISYAHTYCSRYKGVRKFREGWNSASVENGVKTYLGTFKHEVLAAIAYNKHVRTHRGEFARPNLVRFEGEISKLLQQRGEIDRQIDLLCAMELEQA